MICVLFGHKWRHFFHHCAVVKLCIRCGRVW